jgi:hypothetical protein
VTRSRFLRLLYGAVVGLVALGGAVAIVDWSHQGGLPGGGVPVTGRVIEERPGFAGTMAIVEVAYEAGGRERTARVPVPGSNEHPQERTYDPGDPFALLVSRTDPERVQPAGWDSATSAPRIPGWLVVGAAAGLITPLVLRGPRRRLQAAVEGALKGGGGRGI